MQIQVKLSSAKEPLQIPYPADYQGMKSGGEDDQEFHLSTMPKLLYQGEVGVADAFVKSLPYPQTVEKTGCVMGMHPDVKDFQSLAEIEIYEVANGLSSSAKNPAGGKRLLRERKLLVSETLALS